LAAEIAGVDDGEIQEGRERLTALEPALKPLDGKHPFHAEVPNELGDAALVSGAECAEGEGGEH